MSQHFSQVLLLPWTKWPCEWPLLHFVVWIFEWHSPSILNRNAVAHITASKADIFHNLCCYKLIDNAIKKKKIPHVHWDINWRTWGRARWCVWYWRGHALKCIVLGINHQSRMLILPWPCAECGGNGVCGAKDNTAAFVLEENNTADDAALCCCCRPRSHASLCQVTRPDKVAYCKAQAVRCPDLSLYCICITLVLYDFTIAALSLASDSYTRDTKTEFITSQVWNCSINVHSPKIRCHQTRKHSEEQTLLPRL